MKPLFHVPKPKTPRPRLRTRPLSTKGKTSIPAQPAFPVASEGGLSPAFPPTPSVGGLSTVEG